MAGSSISLTSIQSGKSALGGSSVKLDVVAGSEDKGGSSRQNSLNKVAKFRPTQLKNFSSNITKSIDRNKQASKARDEEQDQVKKRISDVKAQSPFANKSPAEARTGAKINIST
tara:strand:- start:21443 stop:21784 length:342 start_codon:yes stop_codon:yes gene_type:complete